MPARSQSYTGLAPLQSPDRAGYLAHLAGPARGVLHEGDFVGASISGSDFGQFGQGTETPLRKRSALTQKHACSLSHQPPEP